MRSTKAVTLKDVALKAGVSQAVVSTVLNDRANNGIFVSDITRQRVLDSAQELSYIVRNRPLPPVKKLSGPLKPPSAMDNRLVALMLGRRFSGNLFTDIFYGVNAVLSPEGYHPIVLDTYAETYVKAAEKEAAALEYVRDNNFAGLILWHEGGPANVGLIASIREQICPVVAIDRRVPGLELDYVGTDNFRGAYAAVQHLIQTGHRRIGHLTSLGMTDAASERLNGYQQALRDANIETNPRHILLALDGGRRLNREMFRQVFSGPNAPTALFLLSDYWAPVVYEELSLIGMRVPEDVALVGFDDVTQPGLEGVELTSMAQDFEGIGKTSAEVILKRIVDPSRPVGASVFPAHLIVRRSSSPQSAPWSPSAIDTAKQVNAGRIAAPIAI